MGLVNTDKSGAMSLHPLASLGANVAQGLLGTAVQHTLNSREAQKAFDRQKKMLRMEYDLNQQAQRNAPLNTRKGLEKAGINPAVMAEGSFSPAGASASGAPSAQVSAPDFKDSFSTIEMQNAQRENMAMSSLNLQAQNALLQAQKDNVEAQTAKTRTEVNRMKDADSGVTENMRSHLEGIEKVMVSLGMDATNVRDMIKQIDSGERQYTLGSLEMNNLFEQFRSLHLGNLPKYSGAEFDARVNAFKAQNPNFAEIIASAPEREQKEFEAKIRQYYASVYEMVSQGRLNEQSVSKIELEKNQLIELIKSIAQSRKAEYLRDNRLMIDEEDYSHLATNLGLQASEFASELLGDLVKQKAGGQVQSMLNEQKGDIQRDLKTPPDKVETFRQDVVAPNGKIQQTLKGQRSTSYTQPRKRSRKGGNK